jgi:hypothetical protein
MTRRFLTSVTLPGEHDLSDGVWGALITTGPPVTNPVTSASYQPQVRIGEVYNQPGIFGVNGSHFHILGEGTVKIRGGGSWANPTDTHVGIDGQANLTTSGRISCLGGGLNFTEAHPFGVHLSQSNSAGALRPRIILSTGTLSENIAIENFGGEAVIRGSDGFAGPFRCSTATTNSLTVNSGSSQTNITSFGAASVIQAANGTLALAPTTNNDVSLQGRRTVITSANNDNPLRINTGATTGPYIGLYASDGTTRRGFVGHSGQTTMNVSNETTNGDLVIGTTGTSGNINYAAGGLNIFSTNGVECTRMSGSIQQWGKTDSSVTTSGAYVQAGSASGANGRFLNSIENAGIQNLYLNRIGTGGAQNNAEPYVSFRRAGTQIGRIEIATTTTVAYQTSSDARLKTEVKGESPLAVVDRLQPKWFVWNDSQTVDYGFFAQEANEVWPNAVSPGGDDLNEDPWMMDQSKLVGLLVGAVQELSARVEELEARLES